jgi:hypothetical protein
MPLQARYLQNLTQRRSLCHAGSASRWSLYLSWTTESLALYCLKQNTTPEVTNARDAAILSKRALGDDLWASDEWRPRFGLSLTLWERHPCRCGSEIPIEVRDIGRR